MRHARYVALPLLMTFAACAWWLAGRRGTLERPAFSHALHAAQGADCGQCHAGVADARDTAKSYLPTRSACSECHEAGTCKVCDALPASRPAPETDEQTVVFSHASHMQRVEGDCTKCHADAKTAAALPVQRPAMALCLTCHAHAEEYQASRCTRCHAELQRLPLAAVAEFSHAGNWTERHGMLSRAEGAACLECHPQPMCADCHTRVSPDLPVRLYPERVERSLIHRGDYLSTHAVEARADGDLCYRCHEASSCASCHSAWGLAGRDQPSPHPQGWVNRSSASFHGREARQRIETCVACHDQGPGGGRSNCVDCHRVGGPGGNPHPAGWDDRHELEDAREQAVCRHCHAG